MNKDTGKKLLYSSGNVAASLTASVFSTYVIFYYVDILKMPAYMIGFAMGLYGVWNAINDPLLGQISDRTRTRWGRRIPYILFGSIPFILFFILIWSPPVGITGRNTNLLLAYFIGIVFLFDTLYTLVIINWTSLFPEMYKALKERTQVSVFRQIFGILGNILGVALPPIIYSAVGWPAMGIGFGIISLLFLGISLLGSREDNLSSTENGLPFFQALKATFSNKSFIIYVAAAIFVQFTFVMLQAVLPFYAKYILKVQGFKESLVLGTIFISAVFWVAFWGKRANKKGAKSTIMLSTVLYGLAMIPFWFVSSFAGALIASAILGIGLAGLIVLLDVLLSDVIDEDELKTGTRREGMYFGINGFMVRLAISFQSVIMGFVLDKSGYDPLLSVDMQPTGAIIGIKLLLVVVPLISLIFAVILYSKYPLSGDRLHEIKTKLEHLHREESGISG